MTKYSLLCEEWVNCSLCSYSVHRRKVVMARGSVVAPVAFVGEAPGDSEDMLGSPFCGPAGILFDEIVESALPTGVSYTVLNLLGCIPKDVDGKKLKGSEIESGCIHTCFPRVLSLLNLSNRQLIVCVGRLAYDWLPKLFIEDERVASRYAQTNIIHIVHPAHILSHMSMLQKPRAVQQSIRAIEQALLEEGLI